MIFTFIIISSSITIISSIALQIKYIVNSLLLNSLTLGCAEGYSKDGNYMYFARRIIWREEVNPNHLFFTLCGIDVRKQCVLKDTLICYHMFSVNL